MKDFRISLETIKNHILESATDYNVNEDMIQEYINIREELLSNYPQKSRLPKCLKTCSTLKQIREYFQKSRNGYKIRRALIDKEFEDVLNFDNGTFDFEDAVEEIEKMELNILPDEVKTKGRELTGVYYMLYCIENSLRIFIDEKFTEEIGVDYFAKITIPASIKKSIQLRKDQEAKNSWLSIRGESELFYIDFKELGDIILTNWDIFKDCFPDQAWIKTKIDELGNCRNLIAHNSYVGEHEREVIKVNFKSIFRQISK